jgi:hypothetical protein
MGYFLMHLTLPMFAGATWQNSKSLKQNISPRFHGAYPANVDTDGKNVGQIQAAADSFHTHKDKHLNGYLESTLLKNGTSYFFTKFHKGLYIIDVARRVEELGHPINAQTMFAVHVPDARVEWIASLSENEAEQLYDDTHLAKVNR